MYQRAIKHFEDDACIRVFAAQFYNIYKNNHRIEQMLLAEAEVRHPRWACFVFSVVVAAAATVVVVVIAGYYL